MDTIISESFEDLYRQHYPKVYRLCAGYVYGNHFVAEDLTQEVFYTIWEKRGTFKNESAFSTWMYRIAINTCLMYIRREKRNPLIHNEIKGDVADHESTSKNDHCELLYRYIEKLNEADKFLAMLMLEEIPNAEIAEILGLSEVNVRVKCHRLKEKLKKYIRENGQ